MRVQLIGAFYEVMHIILPCYGRSGWVPLASTTWCIYDRNQFSKWNIYVTNFSEVVRVHKYAGCRSSMFEGSDGNTVSYCTVRCIYEKLNWFMSSSVTICPCVNFWLPVANSHSGRVLTTPWDELRISRLEFLNTNRNICFHFHFLWPKLKAVRWMDCLCIAEVLRFVNYICTHCTLWLEKWEQKEKCCTFIFVQCNCKGCWWILLNTFTPAVSKWRSRTARVKWNAIF